jgi:hypothetical protein
MLNLGHISKRSKADTQNGFSTLEMLVAMAIFVITISAVSLTMYTAESLTIDSETGTEALSLAQEMIEHEQALARKDFHLVTPTTTDKKFGSLTYHKSVAVGTTSAPDYASKEVTVTVSWIGEHGNERSVSLSSLVTNFDNVVGGDTCDSTISGNWDSPVVIKTIADLSTLTGIPAGSYTIGDLDVYKGYLYVAVSYTTAASDPTFFIFNVSDPANPILLTATDTAPFKSGLAGVRVAEDVGTGKTYAYLASALSSGQLQIIDVTDPTLPAETFFKKLKLSGVGSLGVGNSIFYKSGFVYLGLTGTGGSGPEFNIIDVHHPDTPVQVGGKTIGNNVNAIFVRGKNAYIASPNNDELIVLDVSNPTNILRVGEFSSSTGNGRALAWVGDTAYFGTTLASTPELYVLDTASTTHPVSSGTYDVGPASTASSINGIVARGSTAFVLYKAGDNDGKLAVMNIADPTAPALKFLSAFTLPSGPTGAGTSHYSLDCEGNTLYAATNYSANDIGAISIITASP